MKICAIDPGPHCGIAWKHDDDRYTTQMVYKNEKIVYKTIELLKPEIVVVERFTVVPRGHVSTDGLYTLRMEGGVEAVAILINAKLVIQYPNQRGTKENGGTFMVARAREMLALQKDSKANTQHEIDALAHMLTYEFHAERGRA